MQDLVAALGLVLVIEGLLWAVWPDAAMRLLQIVSKTPGNTLRVVGLSSMAIGVLIVWIARGW
ncbi:MAG: DUF2065 domain-containing protein [Hyphomicrobiaceae bacterium]